MKKSLLLSIILPLIFTINISPEDCKEKIEIEIIKIDSGMAIKSCINPDLYVSNFLIPECNTCTDKAKRRSYSDQNLIAVRDAYWSNECLILPIDNDSDDSILSYMMKITSYSEEEFVIKRQ